MFNFGRSFELAWERMVQILFRPFNLEKWFGMGLSAFLAGLLVGGNGISSFSFQIPNTSDFKNHETRSTLVQPAPTYFASSTPSYFHQVDEEENSANPLIKLVSGLGIVVIIALALLFFVIFLLFQIALFWLGARGQFMFLDNIVRNRSAVTQPWERYAPQAHSVFQLYLMYLGGSLVLLLIILVPLGLLLLPSILHNQVLAAGAVIGLVGLAVILLLITLPIAFIAFNFTEFGIPIMFRNGTLALPALREVLGLIRHHFPSLLVYALIRFGLWLGVVVGCLLLCCVCCIGIIPYLGSVALLPALVFIRVFSLDILAQMNPALDVFTVDGAVPLVPPTRPPLPG